MVTAPSKHPLLGHRVVGTYRLMVEPPFYTDCEFDLGQLAGMRSSILEVGRASVHRDHRNGAVLQMLWRGIAEQAKLQGKSYVLNVQACFQSSMSMFRGGWITFTPKVCWT